MKYKLKNGTPPTMTTLGGETYKFDSLHYREYPQALVSLYGNILTAEPEPKPKETKAQEI